MKQFQSFYGPKSFEKPINDVERVKLEFKLTKELEVAIRKIRSSQNEGTQFRWSPQTKSTLESILDYIEDKQAGRLKVSK